MSAVELTRASEVHDYYSKRLRDIYDIIFAPRGRAGDYDFDGVDAHASVTARRVFGLF